MDENNILYEEKKEKVFYYCSTYIKTKQCNKHYIQEKELAERYLKKQNDVV